MRVSLSLSIAAIAAVALPTLAAPTYFAREYDDLVTRDEAELLVRELVSRGFFDEAELVARARSGTPPPTPPPTPPHPQPPYPVPPPRPLPPSPPPTPPPANRRRPRAHYESSPPPAPIRRPRAYDYGYGDLVARDDFQWWE